MITEAVEQFKMAIASFAPTTQSQSSDMDTAADDSKNNTNNNQNPIDLAAIIQDLKHEIATVVTETKTLFQQQLLATQAQHILFQLTPFPT